MSTSESLPTKDPSISGYVDSYALRQEVDPKEQVKVLKQLLDLKETLKRLARYLSEDLLALRASPIVISIAGSEYDICIGPNLDALNSFPRVTENMTEVQLRHVHQQQVDLLAERLMLFIESKSDRSKPQYLGEIVLSTEDAPLTIKNDSESVALGPQHFYTENSGNLVLRTGDDVSMFTRTMYQVLTALSHSDRKSLE